MKKILTLGVLGLFVTGRAFAWGGTGYDTNGILYVPPPPAMANSLNILNGAALGITTSAPQAPFDNNGGKMLVRGGTAPAISACGTSPSIAGADSSFSLTMGGGTLTSCVVNFGATWLTAPVSCVLQPTNSTAAAIGTTGAYVSAISTTQLTVTGANLTGASYTVQCF